ncbi:MAG TPA: proline iminopeptidase-family hydrolase [archaeon]|nr:proline iminopeptidase-family hydrolase [archaeon]
MKESTPIVEGIASSNGVQLYYKTVGEGEPVVILHGGPGFDHLHMLPMSALAKDYKVVFYDQRATGNSTGKVDARSMTVDNFVEDLEGLRKGLNLGKMNLIGHSWGAVLGMHYGIKYPDNLKTLILLGAYASMDIFDQYFENIQKKTSSRDSRAMKEIEQSEAFKKKEAEAVQKYYRMAIKPFFYDQSSAGRLDLTFGKNTARNLSAVGNLLMRNLGSFDIHDKLPAIKCPTLIIHGDSDPLPWEAAHKVHQWISQSKIVILKNTGHFMFVESPEEFFPVMRDFLLDDKSVASSIPAELEERLKSKSF